MGRARELSMGPKRPRTRQSNPDYAVLKALTAAADPDLALFRTVLDRVGCSPDRPLYAQGVIYTEACRRYSALTGGQYGPTTATY